MGRRSASEWAKVVGRWRRSGLTARTFAEKAGVNASTLSYWAWRLGKVAAPTKRSKREKEPPTRSRAPQRSLQLVELPSSMMPSSSSTLEVALGGDVSVRVPVGFDPETLTRVVRALEATR